MQWKDSFFLSGSNKIIYRSIKSIFFINIVNQVVGLLVYLVGSRDNVQQGGH